MGYRLLPVIVAVATIISLLIGAVMVGARTTFSDDVFYTQREGDGWRVYVLDANRRLSAALGPILRTDTQPDRLQMVRSPDGRFLTYAEGGRIWLVRVATGEKVMLERGNYPAWSPAGDQLAYTVDGRIHIAHIADDGTITDTLAFPRDDTVFDTEIAWSRDGERLLWLRYSPETTDVEVYAGDADGTDIQNISVDPTNGNWNPAWSPDGGSIAYVTYSPTAEDIVLGHPAAGTTTALITGMNYENGPVWSTDGRQLAYLERTGRMFYMLNAVQIDPDHPQHGEKSLELSIFARGWSGLYWLPNRHTIVFAHARNRDLYTVDLDGNLRRLTFDGQVKVLLP